MGGVGVHMEAEEETFFKGCPVMRVCNKVHVFMDNRSQ